MKKIFIWSFILCGLIIIACHKAPDTGTAPSVPPPPPVNIKVKTTPPPVSTQLDTTNLISFTSNEPLPGNMLVKQNDNAAFAFKTRQFQGIPSIGISSSGVLFSAWYTGPTGEAPGNYVTVAISLDNGTTWRQNELIINPATNVRFFDPTFWNDKYGNLYIGWAKSVGTQWDGKGGVFYSKIDLINDTIRYTPPKKLADGIMMNKPIGYNNNEGMLFPISVWPWGGADPLNNGAFVYYASYSDQLKKLIGFHKISSFNTTFPRYIDEHMIVQLSDNSFLGFIRGQDGIYSCTSKDAVTWIPTIKFTQLGATTSSRFYVGKLQSGHLLMVKNTSPNPERTNMTAYLSYDDGATWPYSVLIDSRPNISYPDVVQNKAGEICLVTDYLRVPLGEISFWKFTESDIVNKNQIDKGVISSLK